MAERYYLQKGRKSAVAASPAPAAGCLSVFAFLTIFNNCMNKPKPIGVRFIIVMDCVSSLVKNKERIKNELKIRNDQKNVCAYDSVLDDAFGVFAWYTGTGNERYMRRKFNLGI